MTVRRVTALVLVTISTLALLAGAGGAAELAGQAQFSQPVAPPAGLIVYAVSGTAIANTDGIWASLIGAGYDQAKNLYRGTFAVQLSLDMSKNILSYTRQNLDGSGSITLTGAPEVTGCPQP